MRPMTRSRKSAICRPNCALTMSALAPLRWATVSAKLATAGSTLASVEGMPRARSSASLWAASCGEIPLPSSARPRALLMRRSAPLVIVFAEGAMRSCSQFAAFDAPLKTKGVTPPMPAPSAAPNPNPGRRSSPSSAPAPAMPPVAIPASTPRPTGLRAKRPSVDVAAGAVAPPVAGVRRAAPTAGSAPPANSAPNDR